MPCDCHADAWNQYRFGSAWLLQELGTNLILIRSLLEAVGTFARILGTRFASSGQLLRIVLLPLLERLGDPSPAVGMAAHEVIQAICSSCAYSDLQRAGIPEFGLFIVDGLCAQLRDIEKHPRYLSIWTL